MENRIVAVCVFQTPAIRVNDPLFLLPSSPFPFLSFPVLLFSSPLESARGLHNSRDAGRRKDLSRREYRGKWVNGFTFYSRSGLSIRQTATRFPRACLFNCFVRLLRSLLRLKINESEVWLVCIRETHTVILLKDLDRWARASSRCSRGYRCIEWRGDIYNLIEATRGWLISKLM